MVEKHINAPGQWLYNKDNSPSGKQEAIFCPCVLYGRAAFRLEQAEDHRNGFFEPHAEYLSKAPIYPVFSDNCFAFASFLPFYASFIATLRGDVRQFYSIEGSNSQDCYKGCLFPCQTLHQIEREIDGRQNRRHSDCTGYNPEPPMSPCSSKTSTPDSEPCKSLASIPEDCESSHSSRSRSRRERSIALDPLVPSTIIVHDHDIANDPVAPTYEMIRNHKLNQDTSTLLYPPSIHQLRADSKAPASPPAIYQHDLFQDAGEIYAQPSGHDIGFDRVETFRASPEHELLRDKMTPGAFPTSHDLDNDLVSRATTPQPHGLEDEVVRSNHGPTQ